jgi:hypothetical protein
VQRREARRCKNAQADCCSNPKDQWFIFQEKRNRAKRDKSHRIRPLCHENRLSQVDIQSCTATHLFRALESRVVVKLTHNSYMGAFTARERYVALPET